MTTADQMRVILNAYNSRFGGPDVTYRSLLGGEGVWARRLYREMVKALESNERMDEAKFERDLLRAHGGERNNPNAL